MESSDIECIFWGFESLMYTLQFYFNCQLLHVRHLCLWKCGSGLSTDYITLMDKVFAHNKITFNHPSKWFPEHDVLY